MHSSCACGDWRRECYGPRRGRSLDAVLLVNGGTTGKLQVAAMVRWAKEIWSASNIRSFRCISLPKCRRLWEATDGRPLSWRAARGPLAIARLEAARIGWASLGPFSIRTDLGATFTLTEVSPKRVELEAIAAVVRSLERRLAARWRPAAAAVTDGDARQRLASGPVKRFLAKVPAAARGLVAAAVCNALWTRARLSDKGLLIDPMCPLCGVCKDTVYHRVWKCTAVRAQRERVTSRRV